MNSGCRGVVEPGEHSAAALAARHGALVGARHGVFPLRGDSGGGPTAQHLRRRPRRRSPPGQQLALPDTAKARPAADGALFRTQGTPELREHFGSGNTSTNRQTTYPMLRLVTLMDTRSHILANAAISPYRKGEMSLAGEFVAAVPDNSIALFDKGFFSADLLLSIQTGSQNRHWLIPEKQGLVYREIKRYGEGDYLLQMSVSPQARKKIQPSHNTGRYGPPPMRYSGRPRPSSPHSLPRASAPSRSLRCTTSAGRSSLALEISKAPCRTTP